MNKHARTIFYGIFWDAVFRTVAVTVLTALISLPFLRVGRVRPIILLLDVLITAVPVFVAMLGYNIAKLYFDNQKNS